MRLRPERYGAGEKHRTDVAGPARNQALNRHIEENNEETNMIDELPPFMTVEQAAEVLQLGRSKAYDLTVEWERTDGLSGLPFAWIGHQKRVPREAIERIIRSVLGPDAA